MAAAMCVSSDFEDWLFKRLKDINIDDDVFSSYILGIVDADDSTNDEKTEALMGILAEIAEEPVEEICQEILKRWQASNLKLQSETETNKRDEPSTDAKMSSIMERHATTQSKKEPSSSKQDRDKQRLLARYAEVAEGNSSDDDSEDDGPTRSENLLLSPNTNKEAVDRAVKEQREKQKAEHEKRREQERQQREKDRLKALERKEKEKKRTQKGERRR